MKIKLLLIIGVFALLFFSCEKDPDDTSESDNKIPVLSSISNKTVAAGETENIELSATDMDGDLLTFSISTNPGFLSITGFSQTGNAATATLVIEPGEDVKGSYNAIIQVNDGEGGIASESFTIEVTEPSLALNDYFPIEKGVKWDYRIDFPNNCAIPYRPWFEYPEGLIGTSFTNGMGSWDAGQINFEILVNDVYETTSNSTTWDIALSSIGQKFYFYISSFNSIHWQLIIDNGVADLNIIGEMDMEPPRWQIARTLAHLTSEDLSQKYNISVPAGDYSNCVKSTVNIYGDGTYVSSGTYPIEIYLAPNVGIVEAIGKDKNGTVLYTLELTEFSK